MLLVAELQASAPENSYVDIVLPSLNVALAMNLYDPGLRCLMSTLLHLL